MLALPDVRQGSHVLPKKKR